jgi:3-deoxy-manno-octulosonate cytidylyltransferase (CMP-KDO synthetase)
MKVIGVIPARLESKRLPRKLLANVCGKPLLQWTWEQAIKASSCQEIIIACDSQEIYDLARSFGARAIMTSPEHNSGTERISEVAKSVSSDIIVNIQADEPLMPPEIIEGLVELMQQKQNIVMATAKKEISRQQALDPNLVKVISDQSGFAIYFSRFAIPFLRDDNDNGTPYYKHIGIYAYRSSFLANYGSLPPSYLEQAEKLEQLRVLQAGYRIATLEVQADSWGVDTRQDLLEAEKLLSQRGN